MSAARSNSSPDRFLRVGASRRKDDQGKVPQRGTSARRTEPVRVTVDLTPEDYRALRRLVAELAEATDVPTLSNTAVWRALLHRLDADEDLRAQVAEQITEDRRD